MQQTYQGSHLLLTVQGRLDSNTAPEFLQQALAHIAEDCEAVVVDMADVVYVSSAGLRAFFTIFKKLSSGRLILSSTRPQVLEVFAIAGFDHLFEFHEQFEEAKERL